MFIPALMYAQVEAVCPLTVAKNGDTVILKGEAHQGGHDAWIGVAGCVDPIVLVYADNPNIEQPKPALKRDAAFLQFRKYFDAEKPAQPNEFCFGCFEYRVTGEFEGRLDVTETAGFKRDAETGKITGVVGFGHPVPFTRYRSILTSVSRVEGRKL